MKTIEKTTLNINDSLKTQYMVIKAMMLINLINAILFYNNTSISEITRVLFLIIGAIALIILYYLSFKKSAAEDIPIHAIKEFKVKTFFRKKTYYLKLKDGKERSLPEFKLNSKLHHRLLEHGFSLNAN